MLEPMQQFQVVSGSLGVFERGKSSQFYTILKATIQDRIYRFRFFTDQDKKIFFAKVFLKSNISGF